MAFRNRSLAASRTLLASVVPLGVSTMCGGISGPYRGRSGTSAVGFRNKYDVPHGHSLHTFPSPSTGATAGQAPPPTRRTGLGVCTHSASAGGGSNGSALVKKNPAWFPENPFNPSPML
ncbi:hypothetical protein EDB85DRAFT_1896563 [Lactarius pseudohatsudake]|nr:hypothetical protein EDB85DRAFT_1896563 [Lactarius pseudohatsudake]